MKTKFVTNTALGIALFTVASLILQIPFFQNYYLCMGYIVMAVYTYFFGGWCGALVGTVGTLLYCLIIGHMGGVIGWMGGNMLMALILAFTFRHTAGIKNQTVKIVIWVLAMILAAFLGIVGVKSLSETILFANPLMVRMAKNFYAFLGDAFTLVLSIPVIVLIDKVRSK